MALIAGEGAIVGDEAVAIEVISLNPGLRFHNHVNLAVGLLCGGIGAPVTHKRLAKLLIGPPQAGNGDASSGWGGSGRERELRLSPQELDDFWGRQSGGAGIVGTGMGGGSPHQ